MTRTQQEEIKKELSAWERSAQGQPSAAEETAGKAERVRQAKRSFRFFCKTYTPHLAPARSPQFVVDFVQYIVLGYKEELGRLKAPAEQKVLVESTARLKESEFVKAHPGLLEANPYSLAVQIFRNFGKTTTFACLLPMYWLLHGLPLRLLVTAYTEDKALNHLNDLRFELSENALFMGDSGHRISEVKTLGSAIFTTTKGAVFWAFGSGQNPRGLKVRGQRPNLILGDDMDDDQVVRNGELVEKVLKWWNGAVFGTVKADEPYRRVMVGNLIHPKSVLAHFAEQENVLACKFNILDEAGQPTWPERFPLSTIKRLQQMPPRMFQQEYMNNPELDGELWAEEDIRTVKAKNWGKYEGLVLYGDPAYNERKQRDHVVWLLVGSLTRRSGRKHYHILHCYLEQTDIRNWVRWMLYFIADQPEELRQRIRVMPEVGTKMQSAVELVIQGEQEETGIDVQWMPDDTVKKNKQRRIQEMHPKFRDGQVYFDEAIMEQPGTVKLIEQLKNFQTGYAFRNQVDDGPDALEGALNMLDTKLAAASFDPILATPTSGADYGGGLSSMPGLDMGEGDTFEPSIL